MNRYFGTGKRCFVVAEIGANHDGDIGVCLRTMEAARGAGVDAIKLQYYSARDLVADADRVWAWGPEGAKVEERVGDMFDRLGLGRDELRRAYAFAAELGIPLFCTPFSVEGVRELAELGNPIFKVASSDVSFYPMLDAIAEQGRPVLLSTGKCPLEDVVETLAHLAPLPAEDVVLLHCIASYPAPYDQMNIRVVSAFRERFPGHPVGLSDHCLESEPAFAAVALGACVVEKHFTLDRGRRGPDHWFSLDPPRMRDLVTGIRRLEAALGDGRKQIEECEQWEAAHSRRSIIVLREGPAGKPLGSGDLALLRPGTGIHPRHWKEVLGRRAARDIPARTPLAWEMLEPR
jgi:sialic acid synthase SpsE